MKKTFLPISYKQFLLIVFFAAGGFIFSGGSANAQCALSPFTCQFLNQNHCNLVPLTVTVSGVTGTPPFTISWNYSCASMGGNPTSGTVSNVTSFPFNKDTITFNTSGTATYHITVMDANGCVATDSGKMGIQTCSAQSISVGTTPSVLCVCQKFYLPYRSSGLFNGDNSYNVYLSDCSGDFTNKIDITDTTTQGQMGLASIANSGKIPILIPCNLPVCNSGSGYKIRIDGNSPPVTGTPTTFSTNAGLPDTVSLHITGSDVKIFSGNVLNFTATTDKISTRSNATIKWLVNGSVTNTGIEDSLYNTTSLPIGKDTVKSIITSPYACAVHTPDTSNFLVVSVVNSNVAVSISVAPDSVLCSGTAAIFTAQVKNPGFLQWQSSSDGIAYIAITGATNNTYNTGVLAQSTYYRAVWHGTTNNYDTSNVQKVTLIPQPVAGTVTSVIDSFCKGSTNLLTLKGSSGAIQWQSSTTNGNFTNVAGATNSSYTTPALLQTTYYRVVTGTGACTDTASALMLSEIPSPTASFTTNTAGLEVMFDADGSIGASTYSWDFGDGSPLGKQPNPTHTYSTAGVYDVCLTVGNSSECNYTECQNVSAFPTGIANVGNNGNWKVYPNPAGNEFFINAIDASTKIEKVAIYDVTGRLVMNQNGASFPGNPLRVDVSTLSQGVYYLKITADGMEYVQPVVKQ